MENEKLQNLIKLHDLLENSTELLKSNKEYGPRLEALADLSHEVYLEIKALDENYVSDREARKLLPGLLVEDELANKLARWRSCSYEINVLPEFVNFVVDGAVECLSKYKYGELIITGYNPPWNSIPTIKGVELVPGHFVLEFLKPGTEEMACLYITFSFYDGKKFFREGMTEEEKQWLREDDMGNVGITAYNFDEAWQITCLIAEKLEISKILISCGGA